MNDRVVIGSAPTYGPPTMIVYDAGAGPLAGGSHITFNTPPALKAAKFRGVCGTPEHAPGNVNDTAFDGALLPAAFTCRTVNE